MDAETISDRCSIAIAKLADKHGMKPPLPPAFWIEMRYIIREEIERAVEQSADYCERCCTAHKSVDCPAVAPEQGTKSHG